MNKRWKHTRNFKEVLQFFPTPEGYVKATPVGNANPDLPPTGYAYNYTFNYTDHLGNIRISYTKDPQSGTLQILEENHYYPFGLRHEVYVTGSKRQHGFGNDGGGGDIDDVELINVLRTEYQYKYNGKEWQDELGLNFYDYGARNYDPEIGRWMNVDPLAELYESQANYDYSGNNPVRFVDFNGENYGVKITHDDDKKEILIQANLYFTNSEDLSENIEAIIMWGLSEGTYTTQDGISYDISFDLKAKVIEGKEETDEARADPIGNIIHENDEIQFRRNYEDDFKRKFNDLTGGYTKNNLAIYNRRSVANAMTRG